MQFNARAVATAAVTATKAGVLSLLLLCGCSEAPPSPPAATSESAGLVNAKAISEPLTSSEVAAFLQIVERLPGARPPEPEDRTVTELSHDRAARENLARWRSSIREGLEPARIAASWKHGSRTAAALQDAGVGAEDFASLLSRISMAWAASQLEADVDVTKEIARAEARIEILLRKLEAIERQAATVSVAPAHWRTQTEAHWSALEQTVALCEFLRIVAAVPVSSRKAIAAHEVALSKILPPIPAAMVFERVDEQNILPTGFEETVPVRPGRPEAMRSGR